ncbi:MAG: arsenate reductase ArsC [Thermoplasmatales archaeon]|nr:MAG: arsenate reductase ArsC [Thermoplasmatales archaeon]
MKQKILFLCTQNSARSQIAEGFLKTFYRDKYEVFSAGLRPCSLNPYAVEVMKEIGIDISNQYSKSIYKFKNIRFDIVVTVCDNVKETCPFFPGKKIIHKGFNDPAKFSGSEDGTLNIFRKVRDEIKDWIVETFSDKKIH